MTHVETKQLLKLPLLGIIPQNSGLQSSGSNVAPTVVYERKLTPNLSLNSLLYFDATLVTSLGQYGGDRTQFFIHNLGFGLEPRLYLGMRRRIEAGLSADNLTGNYLGLRINYNRFRGWENNPDFEGLLRLGDGEVMPNRDAFSAFLTFGMQRRLLRYGYFDLNIGLGGAHLQELEYWRDPEDGFLNSTVNNSWGPAFHVQVGLGLAFGEGRPEDGRLCDAMLCFREERQMFKIDLINALQTLTPNYLGGILLVAYEKKLGRSPFSLQLEAETDYSFYDYTGFTGRYVSLGVALGPRYYYNLKRRIAKGKSGNNLSADYLTLRLSATRTNQFEEDNVLNQETRDQRFLNFLVTPAWGIQRRIFRHGYIGYQIGFGAGLENNLDNDDTNILVDVRTRLELGLAF